MKNSKISPDIYKKLKAEWHPYKNGDLRPQDVSPGSNQRCWWLCKNGHDWYVAPNQRSQGYDCPYCSGQKVWVGFNDLGTRNPALASEWHPYKNGELTPQNVTPGSNKKVFWLCKNGHDWQAMVNTRNKEIGCPYCAGKKAWVGLNDLETINPQLAAEWHPTKNKTLAPRDVTPNSNKKCWWLCKNGHEWQAAVSSRNSGKGCPYCSNQKLLVGYNDLKTIHPEIAQEWHPNKNDKLTPQDVLSGSNSKFWWQCDKGHSWETTAYSRVSGTKCPYCTNRKILVGFNDLATTNTYLAKEWDYEKNSPLKPTQVFEKAGRKVWWKCEYGHSWKTSILHRAHGTICPYCSDKNTISFRETILFSM